MTGVSGGGGGVPAPHASTHADGGSDEINQGLHPEAIGLKKKYIISNDVLHSHDAVASSGSDTYTKVKTITIDTLNPSPLTLRVSFDIRAGSSGKSVRGRIYKNGVAYGTEQSSSSSSWSTRTEDLSFEQGDTIELWIRRITTTCYVQSFRVKGTVDYIDLQTAIDDGNVGVDNPFEASNTYP